MSCLGVYLAIVLVGADRPRPAATETAADRVTLKDGSVVRGLVTSVTNGSRGAVELIVRRGWASDHAKAQFIVWERTETAKAKLINEQRRRRLTAWKRERIGVTNPNDKIMEWIDRELSTLGDPKRLHDSVLIPVRISRSDVRAVERSPAPVERLLRLAWLSKLPDPEAMSVADLKVSLEARGYDVADATRAGPPSLERLLPAASETDLQWLARRAATELTIDDGLRFVRFNDLVMPDPGAGGGPLPGDLNLNAAVSELKRVLEIDSGPRVDPLVERLKGVAARGRVGASVTRLQIAQDMNGVSVETTMWVRTGLDRWEIYGSRQSRVLTDDLAPDAGKGLEQDPQIQGAIQLVEMLGLGAVPAELKQRSLRIGAATQRALGEARSAFNEDLEKLVLPVLDSAKPDEAADQRKPS